jgi:hypothetical protein
MQLWRATSLNGGFVEPFNILQEYREKAFKGKDKFEAGCSPLSTPVSTFVLFKASKNFTITFW